MQKFGLKTTKSKRARREAEAEEEAEATLQFKVSFVTLVTLCFYEPKLVCLCGCHAAIFFLSCAKRKCTYSVNQALISALIFDHTITTDLRHIYVALAGSLIGPIRFICGSH